MKKKILGGLFLLLLITTGAFSPAQIKLVEANSVGGTGTPGANTGPEPQSWTDLALEGLRMIPGVGIGEYVVRKQVQGATVLVETLNNPCVFISPQFSLETCINRGVAWIGYIVIWVSSIFLWMSGIVFNFSIYLSLTIKDLVKNTSGIIAAWTVIRDMCNIFFIFMVLAMAIQTIIGSIDFKKPLATLITAALFINFSFFITGVIIDASNVVALGFYDAMMTKGLKAQANGDTLQAVIHADGGISNLIRRKLDIVSIYDTVKAQQKAIAAQQGLIDFESLPGGSTIALSLGSNAFARTILVSLGGCVLILILMFIFVYASVLFFSRTIALLILLATSPLGFVGMVLPQLSGQSNKWWSALWDNAFFGPFYLMVLYVALRLIDKLDFAKMGVTNQQSSLAEFFLNPGIGSMSVILNYILIIGFLLATFKVTEEFKIRGGDFAKKVAGATTVGLAARLGRNTIGRGANRIAETKFAKDLASNSKIAAFGLKKIQGVASNSSFDVRNVGSLDDLGKGGADGYRKILDKDNKAEAEFAEKLGKPEGAEDARKAVEQIEKDLKEDKEGKSEEFVRRKTAILDQDTDILDANGKVIGTEKQSARKARFDLELERFKEYEQVAKDANEELKKLEKEVADAQKEIDEATKNNLLGSEFNYTKKEEEVRLKMKAAEEAKTRRDENVAKGGTKERVKGAENQIAQFDRTIRNAILEDAKSATEKARGVENRRQEDYAKLNERDSRLVDKLRGKVVSGAQTVTNGTIGKLIPGFARAINSGVEKGANIIIVAPREGGERAKAIRKKFKGEPSIKEQVEELMKKSGELKTDEGGAKSEGGSGVAGKGGVPKAP